MLVFILLSEGSNACHFGEISFVFVFNSKEEQPAYIFILKVKGNILEFKSILILSFSFKH